MASKVLIVDEKDERRAVVVCFNFFSLIIIHYHVTTRRIAVHPSPADPPNSVGAPRARVSA